MYEFSGNLSKEPSKIEALNTLAHGEARHLAYVLSPVSTEPEAQAFCDSFVHSLSLEVVAGEELFHRWPIRIDNLSGGALRILFDSPTFVDLLHLFERGGISSDKIAELYIGTGITAKLLKGRIDPRDIDQVERFWNVMSNHTAMCDAIRQTSLFTEEEQTDLVGAVMLRGDDDIAHLNVLRFGLGILFMQAESPIIARSDLPLTPTYEERFTKLCQSGLKETLTDENRKILIKLWRALGEDEATARLRFAERVSEIELAICFPMRWPELRVILDICNPAKGEEKA